MAVQAGRHTFGADQGRVVLLTTRDGLAAQAGHDLTIEVGRWQAELDVGNDLAAEGLTVRLDLNSLVVREGTGGIISLTDRDRREIGVTARKVLGVDRHPEATFRASLFEPAGTVSGLTPAGTVSGLTSAGTVSDLTPAGTVSGTLTLAGSPRPVRLQVSKTGPDAYHATASVRQSDFGIKPYSSFLGALKVSDTVTIAVDVELAGLGPAGAGGAP
jgi:polyisoprenoid-binding protein YceI